VGKAESEPVQNSADPPRHRRWTWLLRLGLSVLVLFLVFRHIPLDEIGTTLLAADPAWLLGALLLTLPILWLAALQLDLLLETLATPMSVGSIFRITLTTEFYAFFLPGYLAGGALRWYRLTQSGAPALPTLAALVFNRLIDITITAALGLGFWWIFPPGGKNTLVIGLLVAILTASFGLHILVFSPKLAARARSAVESSARGGLIGRILARISELASAGEILGSMGSNRRLAVYAVCLARHIVGVAAIYGLAISIGMELFWINIGTARSIMLLATLVPISFAGLGVREGGLIFSLGLFGVSSSAAAALAVLVLLRDLLIRLAGGLVEAYGWASGRRLISGVTGTSSRPDR